MKKLGYTSSYIKTNEYGTTFTVSGYFHKIPNQKEKHTNSVIYSTECPVCHRPVFFYKNRNNSRVFFDSLGGKWPKHPCTDLTTIGPIKTLSKFKNLQNLHQSIFKTSIYATQKNDYSEFNKILDRIKTENNETQRLVKKWLKLFFPIRIVKIKDGSYTIRKHKHKKLRPEDIKNSFDIPFYNIQK